VRDGEGKREQNVLGKRERDRKKFNEKEKDNGITGQDIT
jgi:hypothetical protein